MANYRHYPESVRERAHELFLEVNELGSKVNSLRGIARILSEEFNINIHYRTVHKWIFAENWDDEYHEMTEQAVKDALEEIGEDIDKELKKKQDINRNNREIVDRDRNENKQQITIDSDILNNTPLYESTIYKVKKYVILRNFSIFKRVDEILCNRLEPTGRKGDGIKISDYVLSLLHNTKSKYLYESISEELPKVSQDDVIELEMED